MKHKELLKGVVLLGLLIALVYVVLRQFLFAFTSADASVKASIIAALAAAFSLGFTFWKDRAKARQEAHRESKIKVYSEFYDIMFLTMNRSREGKLDNLESDEEFKNSWMKVARGILFYGSPQVLTAFNSIKVDGGSDSISIMQRIGNVLLAMRADIGLGNYGLDNINIHQIYVKDDLAKLRQTP